MAPTPDTVTIKYFVDYQTPIGNGTMLYRTRVNVSQADAIAGVNAILDVILPLTSFQLTYNGLRKQVPGNAFSVPVTWVARAGTFNSVINKSNRPAFFSAVGRTSGGRRARMTFFGLHALFEDGDINDYRLTASENAAVTAIIAILNGLTVSGRAVGVDSLDTVWYQYFNYGLNAYYQRRARTG